MSDTILLSDERIDKVNEQITLIQKKDGLTFGTDAFLLAAFIKQQRYARAAELGAGTGIISLLCAQKNKFAKIDAIEIQSEFAELSRRNVESNGLSEKIRVIEADVRDVKAQDLGEEIDAVFSNPPYMKTTSGKRNESDRKFIARHEVCGDIDDFCAAAYRLLRHGGKFYCVYRPDRMSSLMHALKANRLEPKIMVFVHADEASPPSTVLVSATKGGAEGVRILPPLLLHSSADKDGRAVLSERANKIYETMSFGDM